MHHRGFSHVGLSTLDLDKTRGFYEGVWVVVADTITIKEGGRIRHIFFDTGRDQLIAFMETAGSVERADRIRCGDRPRAGVPASFARMARGAVSGAS